ncbi:MAG: CotS family spore coat protein [Hespellia sp.]|nr:CotS family spore coat protein [Hespellia sp.]
MKEYELEVLDQYDIEVRSTRKIRGAFFCDTNQGSLLLKEVHFSEKRAPLLYLLCEQLERNGYSNVDTPVLTKEGSYLSTYRDGTRYILKKWFSGKECDVKREQELIAAVRNLANLHQLMKWENKEMKPFTGRNLQEEYVRHNKELRKVREFMRAKVNKGEFELLYLKYFEMMFEIAQNAQNRLQESGYEELHQKSMEEMWLVHGDYNYHNVLFLPGQLATTNFESFHTDIQMADLYYFFRKVMEKHRWKHSLGRKLLQNYCEVRSLSNAEQEYLAIRLSYPEKFWKTANSYYHSNKAWISEKSVEKLRICIEQTEEKMHFIDHIFSFHL